MTTFQDRWAAVRSRIGAACERSKRNPADIQVVAVTKAAKLPAILDAVTQGAVLLGENRIQDAQEKVAGVSDPAVRWHLVGHLQTNKIKTALELFSLIQSVDSVRLAQAIDKESAALSKITSVLLEVNISGESQKYGFDPYEIYAAVDEIAKLPMIKVEGVMGIAPNTPDLEARRKSFQKLRNIFSALKVVKHKNVEMRYLSMGMSDDFEIAIEEGSNMLRLGRVLFA